MGYFRVAFVNLARGQPPPAASRPDDPVIKRENDMTIDSLFGQPSAKLVSTFDSDFQITLLVSALGLALSCLLVPLLGVDLAVLALAG